MMKKQTKKPTVRRQKPEEKRLFKTFKRYGPCTVNEAIDRMWLEDFKKGAREVIEKGPHYYTHMNKHPADMSKEELIGHVGFTVPTILKDGRKLKPEKIWVVL